MGPTTGKNMIADPRVGIMRWILTADLDLIERTEAYRLIAQAGHPPNLVADLGDTPEAGAERLRVMEREDPRAFERTMEALFADAVEKVGPSGVQVDGIPSVRVLRAYGAVFTADGLRTKAWWEKVESVEP